MSTHYTREDVVKMLKVQQSTQTQEEFAARIGISPQLLSFVVAGSRQPGERILKYLKLRKKVVYEPAKA